MDRSENFHPLSRFIIAYAGGKVCFCLWVPEKMRHKPLERCRLWGGPDWCCREKPSAELAASQLGSGAQDKLKLLVFPSQIFTLLFFSFPGGVVGNSGCLGHLPAGRVSLGDSAVSSCG